MSEEQVNHNPPLTRFPPPQLYEKEAKCFLKNKYELTAGPPRNAQGRGTKQAKCFAQSTISGPHHEADLRITPVNNEGFSGISGFLQSTS